MAILDFFMQSPGDLKRSKREEEKAKALIEAETKARKDLFETERQGQLATRDSNQLAKDVQQHKQEREMQEAIADTLPSTADTFGVDGNNLTAEQQRSLRMIDAAQKMSEIKASAPLAGAAQNMNALTTAQAEAPFINQKVTTSADAAITGNQASTANSILKRGIDTARQFTAPKAAAANDAANQTTAELETLQTGAEKNMIPLKTMANRKQLESQAQQAAFTTALTGSLDPRMMSDMQNSEHNAGTAVNNLITLNPNLSPKVWHPGWQQEMMGTPSRVNNTANPFPTTADMAPPPNIQRRRVGSLNN